MTIGAWIVFILLSIIIGTIAIVCVVLIENIVGRIGVIIASVVLIVAMFLGMRWYFQNTASGQRALIDQNSELSNGIERTITVYTADGNIIAEYTGIIDIEDNDGGYILFDYEGKRYMYYNCFVESIAILEAK